MPTATTTSARSWACGKRYLAVRTRADDVRAACYRGFVARLPEDMKWLFWNVDFEGVDPARHARLVLARVLERGRLVDVRWAIERYGLDRIHRFFRDEGHPELTERTVRFWRAALNAENEAWASGPAWRRSSSAPWMD